MSLNNNKGVTIVSLVITIIVLLILSSIAINSGTESIDKANLESLKTNMLLIKAKAKEYVENASFKNGTAENNDDVAKKELKGKEVTDINEYSEQLKIELKKELGDKKFLYNLCRNENNEITDSILTQMGLKDISVSDAEQYLVLYDIENVEVEVYNTKGYTKDGTTYYSLSEIENL